MLALPGDDHRAVGLELDVARGRGEAGAGGLAGVQPAGQEAGLLVADLADGLVAGGRPQNSARYCAAWPNGRLAPAGDRSLPAWELTKAVRPRRSFRG